jgi:hypothetical protein
MDAAFDPAHALQAAAKIVAFVLVFDKVLGPRALDIVHDLMKEWLRRKCFPETQDVVIRIYGPRGDTISEVAKKSPKIKK